MFPRTAKVIQIIVLCLLSVGLLRADIHEEKAKSEKLLEEAYVTWTTNVEKGKGSKQACNILEELVRYAESVTEDALNIDSVITELHGAADQAIRDADTLGAGLLYYLITSYTVPGSDVMREALENSVYFLDGRVDDLVIAVMKQDLAAEYLNANQIEKAFEYLGQAENIYEKHKYIGLHAFLLIARAVTNADMGYYKDALNDFDAAEKLYKELNDDKTVAEIARYKDFIGKELARLKEAQDLVRQYLEQLIPEGEEPTLKSILQIATLVWAQNTTAGLGSQQAATLFQQFMYTGKDWNKTDQEAFLVRIAEQALKDNDTLGAGVMYVWTGGGYTTSSQDQLLYYRKGLPLLDPEQFELLIAFVNREIGTLLWGMEMNDEALAHYNKAAVTFKEYGYVVNLAKIDENRGNVYVNLDQYEEALTHYNAAMDVFIKNDMQPNIARVHLNKSALFGQMGCYEDALTQLDAAEKIFTESGPDSACIKVMVNKGNVYNFMGRYEEALQCYDKAEQYYRKHNLELKLANISMNKGNVYYRLGHYDDALKAFDEAQETFKKCGLEVRAAHLAENMAVIFAEIGLYNDGYRYYAKAESVYRTQDMQAKLAELQMNRGVLFMRIERYEDAIKDLKAAIRVFLDKEMTTNLATAYQNLGYLYTMMDNETYALQSWNEAENLFRKEHMDASVAQVLMNKGVLLSSGGLHKAALKAFNEAEKTFLQRRMDGALATTYQNLGVAYEFNGDIDNAITSYKRSIDLLEKVRGKMRTEEIKTSMMVEKIIVYERLVMLLLEKGKNEEAFYYAERAKARSFLDLISERELDIREGVSAELLRQKQDLLNKISNYQSLLLEEPVDSIVKKFLEVEDALTQLERKIKMESPLYANLVYPEPIQIKDIQKKLLDDKTALMEFMATDDKVLCWTVTKNGCRVQIIDVKLDDLINAIYDYRILLTDITGTGTEMMLEYSVALYEELIQESIEQLDKVTHLIIVPDGPLHYMPFQTLVKDREKFLLSEYVIRYAPSATVLENIDELHVDATPRTGLIAFGNPDFGCADSTGDRGTQNIIRGFYEERGIHFDSLPYTLIEVEKIGEIYDNAVVYTGDHAREARAKNECPDYNVVHFATHGILDEVEPMYSGVVLSLTGEQDEDGYLQVYEVYNMRLRANLVVLSACRTGLGKLTKGEGVVGLSRAFMYAGSPTLVVSLWPVVDISTAVLMEKFYESIHDGMDKDEALRQAQLYLLNETEFALPAFWAPFVLIGKGQ